MSASNLVAHMPRRSSARVEIRTGRKAENFLAAVRDHSHRHSKSLPLRGGDRAKLRKLDPDDTLAMSIHETAEVLAGLPDDAAADVTRALLCDAGKGTSITVALSGTSLLVTGDIESVERDAAVMFARFLADADDVIHQRCQASTRMRLVWQGLAARAEVLMRQGRGES